VTRLTALAVVAIVAVLGVAGGSGAGASAGPAASTSAVAKPTIHKMLIPFPQKRRREMAAYSKHHYGRYKWRLNDPKLVVEHYAAAGSISAIYNTFAPDRPDVEFHQLPGVCSHFAISASGGIYKFVPISIRCRHVVGLNHVAVGIEHVGFSDQDILDRPAQLNASLRLTQWLRCRLGLPVDQVIGHNESLSSPFYKELDPRFKGQTHGDWNHADMQIYRSDLAELGSC
jgi:N-acetylmuramoyl-L-alanine amidase